MPKPQWHPPWKLSRVSWLYVYIQFMLYFPFVVKIFKEVMANRGLYLFMKVVCLL